MKKRDFQKGAISVFLIIILVPSIVMSSIFVDMSRVHLSRGVVASAEDVALNSLMAHYDTDLKDFYGMAASCQNISEFYEEAEKCFINALCSQGMSEEDIDSLLALYTSLVEDDKVNDLLMIDVQTESGNIISEVPDAALGNSSVLIKDQIVEFMKYRAPVELTKGIIDKLKKNDIANVLEEADKNEELVESKQNYANAEAELLEAAFYSYSYIEKYVKLKADIARLEGIVNNIENARKLYEEINGYMVRDLVNTEGLPTFVHLKLNFDDYDCDLYDYKHDEVSKKETTTKTVTETLEDGTVVKKEVSETKYYAKYSKIYSDASSAVKEFEKARDKVVEKAKSVKINGETFDLISKTTGQTDDHAYAVQWWANAYAAITDGFLWGPGAIDTFNDAAKKMLIQYDRIREAANCAEGGESIPSGWGSLKSKIEEYQRRYLAEDLTGSSTDEYVKFVIKLENVSEGNSSKIIPSNVVLSNGQTIPTAVAKIAENLTADRDWVEECYDALTIVIDGAKWPGSKPKKLSKLTDLVNAYKTSFDSWSSNAERLQNPDAGGTSLGAEDWKEINGIKNGEVDGIKGGSVTAAKNNGQDKLIEISESDITQLNTRLVNIQGEFKKLLDILDKDFKYCGKKLVDITNYSELLKAAKSGIKNIPLRVGDLNQKVNTVFSEEFKPNSNTSVPLFTVNKDDPDFDPDLENNKPVLYAWMQQKFKDSEAAEKKLENEKKNMEGPKDKGKEDNARDAQEEANKTRTASVSKTNIYGGDYKGDEFPSGLLKERASFGLLESFVGTLSELVGVITGEDSITKLRDTLYSTEYVMDMFSYHTYETEGLYNLYKDENANKIPTENNKEHLKETFAGKWDNAEKTFTNNKTLTNMQICEANNVAHGAEVEYILYGDKNDVNVGNAYLDIFTIKFLLNTISGFQNFWGNGTTTGRTINSLAYDISLATAGIIPAPLTKTVAILLLTALETGKDLERLSDGFPVEMYKSKDDWRYSINDDWSTNDGATRTGNDSGLFYSDYLYLFLFMGFESTAASEMYLRIGDLMQANLRMYTGSSEYTLKKSQVYFKADATVRVKPLMLAMPIVTNNFSNSPYDKPDWCTFDIWEIRGYS